MQREIKCRARDKVAETYLYSDKFPSMWQFFKELENRGIRHYETEWYTGLLDKNGKEIYEGDIVQFKYANRKTLDKGEVKWCISGYEILSVHQGWFGSHYLDKCEVIGNIYSNKELLK